MGDPRGTSGMWDRNGKVPALATLLSSEGQKEHMDVGAWKKRANPGKGIFPRSVFQVPGKRSLPRHTLDKYLNNNNKILAKSKNKNSTPKQKQNSPKGKKKS